MTMAPRNYCAFDDPGHFVRVNEIELVASNELNAHILAEVCGVRYQSVDTMAWDMALCPTLNDPRALAHTLSGYVQQSCLVRLYVRSCLIVGNTDSRPLLGSSRQETDRYYLLGRWQLANTGCCMFYYTRIFFLSGLPRLASATLTIWQTLVSVEGKGRCVSDLHHPKYTAMRGLPAWKRCGERADLQ